MSTWVAAYGMTDDGVSHVFGPFDTKETAEEWTDQRSKEGHWNYWEVYEVLPIATGEEWFPQNAPRL